METKYKKRICPYSGEEFIPKRRNQIYVNSSYRIAHNNNKSHEKRKYTSVVNKKLAKNYDILWKLVNDEKKSIVHKEYLSGAGFLFNLYTTAYKTEEGNIVYEVYGFKYYQTDINNYKIIKSE
ncbi:hypothetical protein P700755_000958 [Psychroflexus torquis ATCC 700755]|uniref:Uncharacterized protein n=1 Tax=Psychroflexus torquis (strain ATCC 700755 / CIP 106069 / ACAM 623) TaxID=313595 RepID=K4IFS8_PSYTT|nr:hypothetical protein [Psychroflexus torquis]AFU67931.1 hypothetical protein P700755_000958 [Psychroflexus torquis ATCC 700755]